MKRIACVGFGIIGASWAAVFARGGCQVLAYDPNPREAERGLAYAREACADQAGAADRIHLARSLAEAASNADFVQESAPEREALKRELFAELDLLVPRGTVLASSTSEILPSAFLTGHDGSERMLVAHPLNPPHLIPAIEICPSSATSPAAINAAASLFRACGQSPLVLTDERKGFVMNRLQVAVLREAWHLVETGVCSPEAVDVAMREGLARRWAAIGPFATNLLSTREGYAHFIAEYGPTLRSIADDLHNGFVWPQDFGARLDQAMGAPLSERDYLDRARTRDGALRAIAQALNSHQSE